MRLVLQLIKTYFLLVLVYTRHRMAQDMMLMLKFCRPQILYSRRNSQFPPEEIQISSKFLLMVQFSFEPEVFIQSRLCLMIPSAITVLLVKPCVRKTSSHSLSQGIRNHIPQRMRLAVRFHASISAMLKVI